VGGAILRRSAGFPRAAEEFCMLTLTAPAVEAIRTLTTAPGVAEKSGLRIWHSDHSGSLGLTVVAEPESGDQVLETEGIRVFLQSEAALMLRDKAMDAWEDESGFAFQIVVPDRILLD